MFPFVDAMSSLPTSNLSLSPFAQFAQDIPDSKWRKCIVNIYNFVVLFTWLLFVPYTPTCSHMSRVSVTVLIQCRWGPRATHTLYSYRWAVQTVLSMISEISVWVRTDSATGVLASLVGGLRSNKLIICFAWVTFKYAWDWENVAIWDKKFSTCTSFQRKRLSVVHNNCCNVNQNLITPQKLKFEIEF